MSYRLCFCASVPARCASRLLREAEKEFQGDAPPEAPARAGLPECWVSGDTDAGPAAETVAESVTALTVTTQEEYECTSF